MPRITVAAAVAAGLLAAPVVAHTLAPMPETSVTLVAWAQRVGRALDGQMRPPRAPLGLERPSGIVKIKFNCTESGKPGDVSVYKSSGNRWVDQAALRAVQRVATLHPLPDGMSHKQRYVATMLFANGYEDQDRMMADLRAEQAKSNAWFKGPAGVALLDSSGDPVS